MARRIVETAFDLLSNVWQVFKSAIQLSLPTTLEVIKAAVCLHNYLIMFDETRERNEKENEPVDISQNNLLDLNGLPINNGNQIRESFADYFMNKGAVEYQWEKAINGNY